MQVQRLRKEYDNLILKLTRKLWNYNIYVILNLIYSLNNNVSCWNKDKEPYNNKIVHVMIGTAFIAVGLWRVLAYHSTDNHHLGLESSILYWHFVDIVWLFLFISMYYWGS